VHAKCDLLHNWLEMAIAMTQQFYIPRVIHITCLLECIVKLVVPSETKTGEKRVALVPEAVAKLVKLGLKVSVQTEAGAAATYSDADYIKAGAKIFTKAAINRELASANVVATVRPLPTRQIAALKKNAITLSFLSPANNSTEIRALARAGVTALSFDLVPRISRAQSMDALTSQALCGGYRATLIAAEKSTKFFPMLMTAAGTVQPAKVLVLGAGVAGLQAMATAKRLGAVVSAYDVRSSSADEVKSMGATFINLGLDALEGTGGYAREMNKERAKAQQDALKPYVSDADIVITTAAVPGKKAPLLITKDMMSQMKPGSVLVDLAAETGGNIQGTIAGKDVNLKVPGGLITLVGCQDLPSEIATHSSKLYAQNVVSLLSLFTKDGDVKPDFADEIVAGSAIVWNGEVRNALAREVLKMKPLAKEGE
jgi:NAD(P) transhydrogenase subunit alpha